MGEEESVGSIQVLVLAQKKVLSYACSRELIVYKELQGNSKFA